MPDEKDESSGFKVVDRRSFSVEGERREGEDVRATSEPEVAPREARSETADNEGQTVSAGPGLAGGASELDVDEPPLTGFETLVSYLATTAWFQLGLIPGPGGERIAVDFVSARRTIDLLEVLQEKTQGNLKPGEEKMLEDVLNELRLGFVEVEQRGAPKRK